MKRLCVRQSLRRFVKCIRYARRATVRKMSFNCEHHVTMQIACSSTCIFQHFSSAKSLQVASEILPEFEQPQRRFSLCARLTDKYIFSHLTAALFQATGVSASDFSGIQTTCTAPRVHSLNTPWSNAEEQKRASTDTHNDVSTCTGLVWQHPDSV